MIGSVSGCGRLAVLGSALLWLFAGVRADGGEALETRMQQCITLQKGIAANTSFKDALDLLADRWKLDIRVETELFRRKGVAEVENVAVHLPKLVNVRLGQVLSLLGNQVDGACLMGKDHLVFVPRSSAGGLKGIGYKPLPSFAAKDEAALRVKLEKPITLANGIAANTLFNDALALLANQYELNILVEQPDTKETARGESARRQVCLPDIERMPLSEVLQKLCFQADSTYRIDGRLVRIVLNQP